jgi:hypothetical protein
MSRSGGVGYERARNVDQAPAKVKESWVGRHRRRLAGNDRRLEPDRTGHPNGEQTCRLVRTLRRRV